MDGSASTTFAERMRLQVSRAFANRTTNETSAQSELFEQLLCMSFKVQPPPDTQSETPIASDTQSSNAGSEDNVTSKVDDEKEDEPTEDATAVTQAVPLLSEQPIELSDNQPVVEEQVDSVNASKTEESPTAVEETLNSPVANSASNNPLPTSTDDPEAIVDDTAIETTNDASDKAADLAPTDSTNPIVNAVDESSSKNEAPIAPKLDDGQPNQLQEAADSKVKAPDEKASVNSQIELAIKSETAHEQRDSRDDRRADRREKWFERKDESIGSLASELPQEPISVAPARDDADTVLAQPTELASQQPAAATSPPSTTRVDPTLASPIAAPATLSIVPQSSHAAAAAPTVASNSGAEPTQPVTATPTRTVGAQPAKPNAQEQVTEPGLSQQERVRVIQRIARSFNRISSEGGSINLRLHPEHLGSVSVQVRLEGRSLSARLSTETAAARDAIMQDLPALRQRLADQGFDVTKFQVDVAGNGADASFAQSNGQSQFGQSESRSSGPQTDYRRVAAIRESRAAATRQIPTVSNLNWQTSAGIDLQA